MSSKTLVGLLLVGIVFFAGGAGYIYITKQEQILLLENEISDLESEIRSTQRDLSDKNNLIEDLEDDIDDLELDYAVLESMYYTMSNQYNSLVDDYNELNEEYLIQTELRIGNSLTSYYDYLRYEFGPTGSRSKWKYEEESCQFACQLALHDLHILYWIKAEEVYGEDVGQESYAQAWEVLNLAYSYCEIDSGDSDSERIEKILDFTNYLISYEAEMDDSLRAPVETLSLKSGDCDDFSILVSALFEMAGVESGIGFFQSDDYAHAMVLVHLEDLGEYGCYYYDDLTDYEFEEGRWLIIEPQYTIDYQDSADWFEQWSLYMAVEVDYDKATS